VKRVIPTMPPRARQDMETVAAVPIRKDGIESASAVTKHNGGSELSCSVSEMKSRILPGMVVVTAVPAPNNAEKAYAQLFLSGVIRPIKPI
jgi:hypothetical protein